MATFTLLADNTLNSNSSAIFFQSISGIYTDLEIIGYVRPSEAQVVRIRLNNNTGNVYRHIGTGPASQYYDYNISYSEFPSGSQTNIMSFEAQLGNYASSATEKACVVNYGGKGFAGTVAIMYESTTAISRVDIYPSIGTFLAGSRFTLYGITV